MLLCRLYIYSSQEYTDYILVCPYCSNALTVSRSEGTVDFPSGQNRLECRTCPYQYLINQRWFERKEMKRKEVDDVLGGRDAWANVDKTEGVLFLLVWLGLGFQDFRRLKLTQISFQAQCTRDGCEGTQAYFKQIQIRSADEPMTIFYRVGYLYNDSVSILTVLSLYIT